MEKIAAKYATLNMNSRVYLLLAVALLATFLLAACGGPPADKGEASPAAAESSAAAAPAEATDHGDMDMGAEAAAAGKVSESGTEDLLLIRQEFYGVPINLVTGDVLRIVYTAQASSISNPSADSTGLGAAAASVVLAINDPYGDELYAEGEGTGQDIEWTAEVGSTVEITAEDDGEYAVTFFNPHMITSAIIKVDWFRNPVDDGGM